MRTIPFVGRRLEIAALLSVIVAFKRFGFNYAELSKPTMSFVEKGLGYSSNASPVAAWWQNYSNFTDEQFFQALLSRFNSTTLPFWNTKILTRPPLNLPQLEAVAAKTNLSNPYGVHPIQRIYYNNLKKNTARREHTDAYLGRIQANTGVPFHMLEAQRGDDNVCVESRSDPGQCIGVSGLAYSLLHVLKHEKMTGPTLVLEDDYYLNDSNFSRLYAAMDMLPDDWDIVRFDCWGMFGKEFAATINHYVVNTTTFRVMENCRWPRCDAWFAGGTYSMLWRGRPETVKKLIDLWSVEPFTDVDVRLNQDAQKFGLISYCVNIHLGTLVEIPNEVTDIPKVADEKL